jgi:FkbM family methyltransferase
MSLLSNLRGRLPLLDRAIRAAPTQRVVRSVRRRGVVEDPVRFAALELFGAPDRRALHRLRDSPVRIAVRHRSRDVDIVDEIFAGRPLYEPPGPAAPLLRDGISVLDLGGNVGLFGAFVLKRFPRAAVVSVEPDPLNVEVIQAAIAANDSDWRLVRACAAAQEGTVSFHAGDYADSRVAHGPGAGTVEVAAVDVFPLIESSDYVKMDIEGAEWPILLDERFATVKPSVFVIEWHQQGCPLDDARATAVAAFRGAGYDVKTSPDNDLSYGMIWAWRAQEPR